MTLARSVQRQASPLQLVRNYKVEVVYPGHLPERTDGDGSLLVDVDVQPAERAERLPFHCAADIDR